MFADCICTTVPLLAVRPVAAAAAAQRGTSLHRSFAASSAACPSLRPAFRHSTPMQIRRQSFLLKAQSRDFEPLDPDVWKYKPAWCQPWSILGTGSAVVAGVWAVSGGSTGWTVASAVPVVAWWVLFLGMYPLQFKGYVEEENERRRQLVLQRQEIDQQQQEHNWLERPHERQ